jgi:signal transduction histidine kinase
MSIRTALRWVFGVAFMALLVAVGALFVVSTTMGGINRRSGDLARRVELHRALLIDMSHYMVEANELFVLEAGIEHVDQARKRMELDFEALGDLRKAATAAGLPSDAEELERIEKMRSVCAGIVHGIDELWKRTNGKLDKAGQTTLERLTEQMYDHEFRELIDSSIAYQRRELRSSYEKTANAVKTAKFASAGVAAIAVFLLVGIVGSLLRSVDRGLRILLEGAERLASGAIEHRVPSPGGHEFGRLADAFNQMAESLGKAHEAEIRMEKLAAIGQVAASVAHDLRNPLGAIRNANYYLRKRLAASEIGADARVAQSLDVIERETASSTTIIGNLLDFGRARRLSRSACPLRSLVADAISVVAPPRPTRIDNEVAASLPVPDLDKEQFRQALVNLIQNATEALSPDRDGHVRITAEATPDAFLLSVTDNGSGLSEEQQEHIFEPLFSTKVKGTGLGLSITEGIVRRHDGTIEVQSEIGKGTTFTIRLPREAAPPAPAADQ